MDIYKEVTDRIITQMENDIIISFFDKEDNGCQSDKKVLIFHSTPRNRHLPCPCILSRSTLRLYRKIKVWYNHNSPDE
ncbi:MAG: hypothetical protein IJ354_05880 [Clostridia bacterium]|nr:hypothetical protein [Clostridia bacterium]